AEQMRQPLIALRQQLREHALERVELIAERACEQAQRLADRIACRELAERTARGEAVLLRGIVDDARARDAARQYRQLLREPDVQRIERVDAQALRLRL